MKQSRQQLAAERDRLSASEGVLHRALNDVLNKQVTWFKAHPHAVGVSRVCGPDGGLAIVTYAPGGQLPYTCCYLWDAWYAETLNATVMAKTNTEAQQLRALAIKVQSYVMADRSRMHNS